MTQPITSPSTSVAGELASLLLEIETNQSESSRLARDAARENYLEQSEQQVNALHAAADATRAGAFISAGLTVASGGFAVGAATSCGPDARLFSASSKTCGDLSAPLRSLVGESTAADLQATAKLHETLAEQAKWEASDASTSADKADRRGDKALDLLQGIQSDSNSSANAIIGRI